MPGKVYRVGVGGQVAITVRTVDRLRGKCKEAL
jgi:hypothetical protein